MVCEIFCGEGPMTAAQFFGYLRHRYAEMSAYFNREKDAVVIPLDDGVQEAMPGIMEMATRKGLYCTTVSAAWPEYLDGDILAAETCAEFLVVYEVKGKFIR